MNHAITTTVKMILDDLTAAIVEEIDGNQEEAFNCFGRVAGWFIASVDTDQWGGPVTRAEALQARRLLAGLVREAHEILGQPFPELTVSLDEVVTMPIVVALNRVDANGCTVLTGTVDGLVWTAIVPDGEGPTVLVDSDGESMEVDTFMPDFALSGQTKRCHFIATTLAELLA